MTLVYSRNRHTWLFPHLGDGIPDAGQLVVCQFPNDVFAGRWNDDMTDLIAWFPLDLPTFYPIGVA